MPDLRRVAVIGTGFAQQVHVPAFRADPRCEVVAIASTSLERAKEKAARLGIPKASGDWRELVASPEIDIVSVAVPPSLQPEVAAAAAAAGKHLFCEKPAAIDAAAARMLLDAVGSARVHHAINFIFPELAAFVTVRELVRDGEIGEVLKASVNWHVDTRAYRPGAPESWKSDPARGGGVLNSFGSHVIHYVEWLLGPVREVRAFLSGRGESGMSALLRCGTGCDVTVSLACNAPGATGHSIEIVGSRGTIVLENRGSDYVAGFTVTVRAGGDSRLRTPAAAGGEEDGRLAPTRQIVSRLLDAIDNAIDSAEEVSPNLKHGLRVAVLTEALRESAATAATGTRDEHVPV